MTSKKKIAYGIITNYFQYIFNILLGIVLSPLVLKFAGQETMGAYAILLQMISYVGLVDLGIGFSASRFMSQAYAISHEEFEKTSNMYRSVGILQSAVIALIFIVLSFYLQSSFKFTTALANEMQIGLWILAGWTLISSFWSFYGGILNTTNYMSAQNIIDAITNAIKILLAILFVVLGWSIIGLITAQVVSQFLGLVAKWVYSNKKLGRIRFRWTLSLNNKFKEILFFSFNSFMITIAMKLVFSTDNLVIGYLYGPIAVSIYYMTFQPGNMFNQFILKITDNFTPTINIWYANQEHEKLKSSFFFLFRITFFLTVLTLWGIVFCTEPVITLWVGKANYLAQPMALWCGLFSASIILGHVPSAYVMAEGKIRVLGYFALFEGFLNLTLSLTFGKLLGSHAVMMASFIANVPSLIYLYNKGLNILDCKKEFFLEILHWKYIVSILFIPIAWMILSFLMKYYDILQMNNILLSLLLVILIYPIAIYYMYRTVLSDYEKDKLLRLIKIRK